MKRTRGGNIVKPKRGSLSEVVGGVAKNNHSSLFTQMHVDSVSVGVGESATPTSLPSVGGSHASSVPTVEGGSTEPTQQQIDEEYLQKLKEKERSDIWEHYTRKMVDNRVKGVCQYCGKEYFANPTCGTSNLISHIDKCKKYPPNIEKMKARGQRILSFKKETKEKLCVEDVECTSEELDLLCTEMIILDELPFSHVDGLGFQRLMKRACPFWKIPSRMKIARDVLKVYMGEKVKLRNQLRGKRVCLTTDTWTSVQNINYMVVTVHFIDDDWVLHKRVLNFCVIVDHRGESIAKILEDCLLEWGIEKILTITVDNATSNDVALRELIKSLGDWGNPFTLLHGGKNVHERCVAHVVNLIVGDGLRKMNFSVDAIRNAVRYVRSSPQRLDCFKSCVERVKGGCKGLVVLDVPTRWNSTFLMLESALKFQKAFDRLGQVDTQNYLSYFRLGEKNEKQGPPATIDWKNAEVFKEFLEPFYDVTLRVCCSNSPTIHQTFGDLLHLHCLLQQQKNSPSVGLMEDIVPPMEEKFNKYWGDFGKMNQYVFVAIILDPRQKFERLVDYFEIVFGDMNEAPIEDERVEKLTHDVKDLLYDLYDVYVEEANLGQNVGASQESNKVVEEVYLEKGLSEIQKKLKEKELKRKAMKAEVIYNDVDRYLSDPVEGDNERFDLLYWWRVFGMSKYPTLARIARDILAIPVSTISSESCFSTSGRVINPHRSSLSPKIVEALICTQSWLRGEHIALHHVPTIEEMEICEEAERDNNIL